MMSRIKRSSSPTNELPVQSPEEAREANRTVQARYSNNFRVFRFLTLSSQHFYFFKSKSVNLLKFIEVAIIFVTFIIEVYGAIFVYFFGVFLCPV